MKKEKIMNLIYRRFILFLPLEIGVAISCPLLLIGNNITNIIIKGIFVGLGAIIIGISLFVWIFWAYFAIEEK